MNSLESDDQLTIVNQSKEYRVSKQIIRKLPYFEKVVSHDLKDSKENKVKLNFDEHIFELVLNLLEYDFIFIEMDNVINVCTIADYFGFNNNLIDDCTSYFWDNFTIEDLPVVIPQVTSESKLLNSILLDAFICSYFTKIANTTIWLDYPIETIEYICKLDLMVYSECQVFDSIMKWISFKFDLRKCYLKQLLKLIRWCYLEAMDLLKLKANGLVESSEFQPELCSKNKSNCECSIDRTQKSYFVMIEELNATELQIKLLNDNFMPLVNRIIKSDESIPLGGFHNKHISDIVLDSGNGMIRIDWKEAKYRLLDYSAYKNHYRQIHKLIFQDQESEDFVYHANLYSTSDESLIETNDKFIFFRLVGHEFQFYTNPTTEDIGSAVPANNEKRYLATVLSNFVYILTKDLELSKFNIESKRRHNNSTLELFGFHGESRHGSKNAPDGFQSLFKSQDEGRITGIHRFKDRLDSDNLILTCSQANDDKLILVNKSTKVVFFTIL